MIPQALTTATIPSNSASTPLGPECEIVGGIVRANLGAATQVSGTEVAPIMGVECAISGGQVRATLASGVVVSGSTCAPNLGAATQVSAGSIVPVYSQAFLKVSGGEVKMDLTRNFPDLVAGGTLRNPNAMSVTVTSLGSNQHRVQATQQGTIRDGLAEGWSRFYSILGPAGEAVDLSQGKHGLEVTIEVISATAGDSLIIMAGVGTDGPSTVAGTLFALAGFSTGTASLERSTCVLDASNGTTAAATLSKVCLRWLPPGNTSGSFDLGAPVVCVLNSSGAIVNTTTLSPGSDAVAGTVGLIFFVGFDVAGSNTKSADIKVSYFAFPISA